MKNTLALILAGGRGKRMDILCQERPKPLLPFAGAYRVIDLTLSNCIYSQIEKIAVLVDYKRPAIIDYLSLWDLANQPANGITMMQPRSSSYNGTADAVYQNLDYLGKQDVDTVLILAGDHIYNMDYRQMLGFHQEKQADITVGITRVPDRQASRFGTLTVKPGGRIQEFVEKSSSPISNLASMGIYVFNRIFLMRQLMLDAANPNSPHDFGYAILPRIIKQDNVFGYEFKDYWQDIGTVESYYQANMQLLGGNPGFAPGKNRPVLSVDDEGSSYIVKNQDKVVNSLVSPGCIVEGYVENSILSPGVKVEEKAEVVNSIVMANTRIGYHSIVDTCILDEGVDIDKFCFVGFGTASTTPVSDITLVGKDARLGPDTAIGRKARIMPGIRLGETSYKSIALGSITPVPPVSV